MLAHRNVHIEDMFMICLIICNAIAVIICTYLVSPRDRERDLPELESSESGWQDVPSPGQINISAA